MQETHQNRVGFKKVDVLFTSDGETNKCNVSMCKMCVWHVCVSCVRIRMDSQEVNITDDSTHKSKECDRILKKSTHQATNNARN